MWFRVWSGFLTFVALFSLVACKLTLPKDVTVDGNGSVALACVANVSNNTVFAPGQTVTIQVTAQNGAAPYVLTGVGNFSASTTITRTYNNQTNYQIVVQDQVSISDSQGHSASCGFSVNVSANVTNPGNLTCQISGSVDSVLPNNNVTYNMVANGTGSITFSNFQPGSDGIVTLPLTVQGPLNATAAASYSAVGVKTASVMVTDSAGNVASCSDTTTVRSNPAISVVASPSASVPVGTSINLTANLSNFTTTPSVMMTTSEPGVSVVMTGANTARVDATNNLAHSNFSVLVTAINGSESASATATLSFTGSTSLNCSLTYPQTILPYKAGDSVAFTVSSPTDTLVVTSFFAPNGELQSSNAYNTYPVRYPAAGTYTVTAYARSASSGVLCNNGAALQATITIQSSTSAGSCSVVTYNNPAGPNEWFQVSVTPNVASSALRIYQIDATDTSTGLAANGTWQYASTRLTAWAAMYHVGFYNLKVTLINDSTGATFSCSTQQSIFSWWY